MLKDSLNVHGSGNVSKFCSQNITMYTKTFFFVICKVLWICNLSKFVSLIHTLVMVVKAYFIFDFFDCSLYGFKDISII